MWYGVTSFQVDSYVPKVPKQDIEEIIQAIEASVRPALPDIPRTPKTPSRTPGSKSRTPQPGTPAPASGSQENPTTEEPSVDKSGNTEGFFMTQVSMYLTHWGRGKMDAFLQTTVSNAFSWMKMYEFW